MTIVLSDNQYGKAETHLVRVSRDGETHRIKDLVVSGRSIPEIAEGKGRKRVWHSNRAARTT